MTVTSAQSLTRAVGDQPVPLVRLDNEDPGLLEAVARVAARSAFTLGEEVEAFENEFAHYCGSRHAVGVSSGTEALVLALRALDIGSGDEVIVPTNSFIASAEAVSLVGADARLVDVDPMSGLLTAEILERSITSTTRAVIPVHLYGATVDMDPIVRLADEAGVAVIEDACQAHGAFVGEARTGSLGGLAVSASTPPRTSAAGATEARW